MYHVVVTGKHAYSEFIHIYTVMFCTVWLPCLSRSSLQVSAPIAHYSKALLKLNQSILPFLYPYVTEAVHGILARNIPGERQRRLATILIVQSIYNIIV